MKEQASPTDVVRSELQVSEHAGLRETRGQMVREGASEGGLCVRLLQVSEYVVLAIAFLVI